MVPDVYGDVSHALVLKAWKRKGLVPPLLKKRRVIDFTATLEPRYRLNARRTPSKPIAENAEVKNRRVRRFWQTGFLPIAGLTR